MLLTKIPTQMGEKIQRQALRTQKDLKAIEGRRSGRWKFEIRETKQES